MDNAFAQLFAGFAPKTNTPKKNFLDSYGTSNAFLGAPASPKPQTPIPTPVGGMSIAPKQSTIPVASNAGATGTAPTKPTAPASPAKQAFIQSQTNTDPQPITGETTTPSGAVVNAGTGSLVTAPKTDPNATYRAAFDNYLASLKPSDAETSASKNLADLSLQAQKDQEEALGRGETLGFATGEAARVNRNNSFGITAASNAVNALSGSRTAQTDATKARLDFEKGILDTENQNAKDDAKTQADATKPFDLSEGQSHYVYNPKTKAYEKTASVPKTYAPSSSGVLPPGSTGGNLSALAQAVQNGTIALDKIPIAQRAQIAAELATSGIQSPRQQALSTGLDIVDSLMNENTDAITGVGQNPLNYVGLSNSKALNLYNQLKGTLSLENRQQLKGQGAISDFEFKVLSDAASSLGRNLNNKDFRETLQKIKDVYEGKYRQTTALNASQAAGGSDADPLGLFPK